MANETSEPAPTPSDAGEAWSRWEVLTRAAQLDRAQELFRTIADAYGQTHRFYHNLRHVLECLRLLDGLRHRATSPMAVEFAVWMHDLVYDTHRNDNEERSAELAREYLSRARAGEAMVRHVPELVFATRHAVDPMDSDQALVAGVDLAILGQPVEVFDRYEEAVRREYSWVPDAVFWTRRVEILESFLARPAIYHDTELLGRFETSARDNLRRAIDRARANARIANTPTGPGLGHQSEVRGRLAR